MSAKWFIVCSAAVVLTACSTLQQLPIDDAYYWPEKIVYATPEPQPAPAAKATQTTPASPRIEYLNVQDTTVTVRIKK